MNKASELMIEMLVAEGVNDKNIFKAIIMAGGGGSGKSFVLQEIIGKKSGSVVSGLGAVVVNSDDFLENNLRKLNIPMDLDPNKPEQFAKQMVQRKLAKALANSKLKHVLDGMLPIVLDGTGKDFAKIKAQKEGLEAIGYDVSMVFVNTSMDVALERNRARARHVPEDIVRKSWSDVQDNLGAFQSLFGGDMLIIDNSKRLEGKDLKEFQLKMFRSGKKMLEKPVKSRNGTNMLKFMKLIGAKVLSDVNPKTELKFKVKA